MSPGKDTGIVAMLGKHGQHTLHVLRTVVFEGRWDHLFSSLEKMVWLAGRLYKPGRYGF